MQVYLVVESFKLKVEGGEYLVVKNRNRSEGRQIIVDRTESL